VLELISAIRHATGNEISLAGIDSLIPVCKDPNSNEQIALTLGCALLKEFAFKFLTYVNEEVTPSVMKPVLLTEYTTILQSLVTA
jgi:hypothetical protein